jgi:hypothetical protein
MSYQLQIACPVSSPRQKKQLMALLIVYPPPPPPGLSVIIISGQILMVRVRYHNWGETGEF